MSDLPPNYSEDDLLPDDADMRLLNDDGELPFDFAPEKPKKRPPSRVLRRTYISLPLVVAVCLLLVCSAVLLLATSLSNGSVMCNLTRLCAGATVVIEPTRSNDPVPPRNEESVSQNASVDTRSNTQTIYHTTLTPAPYSVARCNATADYHDHLLFTMEGGANTEVFVIGADGSGLCRVTDNLIEEGFPSWSPDRTRILFFAQRSEAYGTDLYSMNLEGADIVNLTQDEALDYSGDWSPDGQQIVFTSNRDSDTSQIYAMNADGSNVRNLTPDAINAQRPSWSPDGQQVVYMAGSDGDPNKFEIYVVDVATAVSRRLTHDERSQSYPTWSPQGTQLLFSSANGARGQGLGADIYAFNLSDNSMERVTYDSFAILPSWSPDGKAFAYISGADFSLNILDLDNRQTRVLPTRFAIHVSASWR